MPEPGAPTRCYHREAGMVGLWAGPAQQLTRPSTVAVLWHLFGVSSQTADYVGLHPQASEQVPRSSVRAKGVVRE